eukprot:GHUV01036012.1.p1 GENE.GHUV01036012.1~~GHUV01036012.1.p1  ORF type:complete len:661 (+),score=202.40 GHUV01036012.1:871-2853(+)
MAGLLRTVLLHQATASRSGTLSGSAYLDLLRSFAVLHTSVYNAVIAAQALAPARLSTSTPTQQHEALQHTLPLQLGPSGVYGQPAKLQHPFLGQPQVVVAVLSDPGLAQEQAVTAASAELMQLLQHGAKHAAQEGSGNFKAQLRQLAERLHSHVQSAAIPIEQLLQLLEASSSWQELPAQLTQDLVQSLVHSMPQLDPYQLAAALNACASVPGALQGTKRFIGKAVTAYLKQKQHAFDAASIPVVAAALAKCRQRSSFSLLSMLAMDHIQKMSAQQLVQLLGAFAHAQHFNQAVMGAAAKLILASVKQQSFKLSPVVRTKMQNNSCNQVPTALAAAEQQIMWGAHDSQTASQDTMLTADDLVQLLHCCAQLRHHDAQLLEAAAIAVTRSLKHMQLQQVVAVVTACAQLNHYSTGLFEEACRLVQQALSAQQQDGSVSAPAAEAASRTNSTRTTSSNRTQQPGCSSRFHNYAEDRKLVIAVTDLAWSCALMGHLNVPFWEQVACWSTRLHVEDLNEEQLLRWFQVQTYLTDAAVSHPNIRSLGLSNSLLIAAHDAWMQKLQGQSLTLFHKEVHDALKQAGTRCRLNVALDGPLVVDVALQTHHLPNRRAALQLETPEMFASNPPYAALGPTAARWRALQCRGWRVRIDATLVHGTASWLAG